MDLPAAGDEFVVHYRTSPDAAAIQWLAPEQTAGRVKPFLFTQGQAILTRTWVPTQDSPGIRQTYEASITVPDDLVAVMSAEQLTPEGEDGGVDKRRFRFGPMSGSLKFKLRRAIAAKTSGPCFGGTRFGKPFDSSRLNCVSVN